MLEKIDIVYTWVDGSDKKWLKKKKEVFKKYQKKSINKEMNDKSRFKNRDELKYSLRSVSKYAKWVQNIYIVTDNQKPEWLNCEHPQINIIDHADLFDKSNLPLFNSNVIGSRLHHIKGLSNNFLYLNDDVMLGRPTKKTDFFDYNKKPKLFVGKKLNMYQEDLLKDKSLLKDNAYQRGILNSRRLIFKKFNIIIPYVLRHGVISYNKAINFHVETSFWKEVNNTYNHQFRTNNDFVFSTLVAYYLIATNEVAPTEIKPYRGNYWIYIFNKIRKNRDYVYIPLDMKKEKIINKFEAVKKYCPLMFCINDASNVSKENSLTAINGLDTIFPEKSDYEK